MYRTLVSCLIAFGIFSAGTIYTFTQTKLYESSGQLQVAVHEPLSNPNQIYDSFASPTQMALQILQSKVITKGVSRRLNHEERERFSIDSPKGNEVMEVLYANRSSQLIRHTNIVQVNYRHPDPVIAARVCNLYMEEYINYQLTLEIDSSMRAVEDLRIRAERQNTRIEELRDTYQALQIEQTIEPSASSSERLKALEEEISVQETFREKLQEKLTQEKATVWLRRRSTYRVIEAATPPGDHVSPNIPLQLGLSLLLATCGGLFSFFVWGKFSRSTQ